MRFKAVMVCLLFVVFGIACCAQAVQASALKNEDVVKMTKAGLGEQIIITMIESQPSQFDLSTDGLILLKTGGVSQAVIAAMISKSSGSPAKQQAAEVVATTKEIVLRDGTEVRMRLRDRISSATAKVDQPVYFEAGEDVKVGGVLVIAAGASGRGRVLEVSKKKSFGRRGKLDFSIDVVKGVDGENIPLRATRSREGDESYAKAGVVTYLAGPFGLLVKGKDVEIEAGTEYIIYINGDRRVNIK